MTILRAQMEANERGLCRCGQRATSELSYAEEMDQRQDASSPSPPSSPPTDGSYQTPVTESVTRLVPVPEDVQLARREDIMDGRVCANRVKIDELSAKVTLVILDALVEY